MKVNTLVLMGFLSPILIFLGIFFITGHLNAVIDIYFGETASQAGSLISVPNMSIFLRAVIGFSVVYVFALFFTGVTLLDFVETRKVKLAHFLLIWAFIFSLLMAISTSGPYLVHTLPPSVLMAAIVIESRLGISFTFPEKYFGAIKKNIKFNSLVAVLLAISLSTNFWVIYSLDDRQTLDDQKEIANYIKYNTEENETILVYHYAPVHYYLSERDPPYVDFRVLNIGPGYLMDGKLEELLIAIQEDDVKYLIVYKNMLEPDILKDEKYPATAELKKFFLNNYNLEEEGFQEYDIYYRQSNSEWI